MRRLSLTLLAAACAALALASPASAAFGLHDFDVTFTGPDGATVSQAGSHPFQMNTSFKINTEEVGSETFPVESTKDLFVALAPGFVGDQTATPRCSTIDFLNFQPPLKIGGARTPDCADGTAVGLATIEIGNGVGVGPQSAPLYNLEPPPGSVARLGFVVQSVPVTVDVVINEAFPYNVVAITSNISQALEVFGAELAIWGVPADPAHDEQRGRCFEGGNVCPPGTAERPFLTLPRSCTGPIETSYELDSWQKPGIFTEGSVFSHDDAVPPNPAGISGCGKLGFSPRTAAQPSTQSAESASGLDFSLDVEDEGLKNPEGLAQADIEEVITAFPPGVTLNPSAAEGLGVCTIGQYEAASLAVQGCPDAAKVGTMEAQTPLLEDHTLHGSLYVAQQDDPATAEPEAENPFDSLLALYFLIRDPELGIFVKLAAEVEPDPLTGQLITTLEGLPQFPLGHVDVHLREGPRAPLVTPPTCGTYTTAALLVPSSGAPPLTTTSSFQVTSGPGGSPCPAGGVPPFSPGFEAGAANNAASSYSPFSMRLTRADGQQDITRFSATLPPGVVAKIAGVGRCPDAQIALAKTKSGRAELAAPSCPASSLIGHLLAGAGVGSALTYVPGSLYLAGPYNGAPLSVAAIVPAVAGPFDVGTVVTRVALKLNPTTYRAEVDGAASDPIPHILEGIPLKLRDLRVYADRPDFTLNATSCAPSATAAQIFGSYADPFNSADDRAVAVSSRYQVASCASLAFKPKLALQLKGGTKRNDHPALHSTLTYPYPSGPGYANVGKAVVTLPRSEFLDPNHVNNPCTRPQFKAGSCPANSILGTARAMTPLLDDALEGPVYFLANGGERALPDVVADLNGTFHITLVGKVDAVVHGEESRIRTTFDQVPDAPVSKFTLNLKGGKKQGLLVNSANLCAKKQRAKVSFTGQNGRRQSSEPVIKTSCKAKKAKRQKRGH
jgi:hypothetical protein